MSTLTTWAIPGPAGTPFQISAGGNFVSFTAGGSYVGMLDPVANHITQWHVPYTMTSPGDILNHNGQIWLTSSGPLPETIVRVDPVANTAISWPLPPSFPGGPRHLAFDRLGNVLFTAASSLAARAVGMLHAATNGLRMWSLPAAVATTSDWIEAIAYDPVHQKIYANVQGSTTNSLVQLDPGTGTLTSWSVAPSHTFASVAVDAAGDVFFLGTDSSWRNIVARLEPSANKLTEWTIPAPNVNEFLALDQAGLPSFTGVFHTPLVGRLNPAGGGVSRSIAPTTAHLRPIEVTSEPVRTSLKPATTAVAPKVAPLAPTISGAFTIWGLPIGNDARAVSTDASGELYVTMQAANSIGRISP